MEYPCAKFGEFTFSRFGFIARAVVVEYGLTSPTKHIIGHIGDDFYGSDDPTNSVKALKDRQRRI